MSNEAKQGYDKAVEDVFNWLMRYEFNFCCQQWKDEFKAKYDKAAKEMFK